MRKRSLLIVLVVLGLGLIGTGLSTFLTQNEFVGNRTFKVSYGFPIGWEGYSIVKGGPIPLVPIPHPEVYWFSLGSFLVDYVFWVAVSLFACWSFFRLERAVSVGWSTRVKRVRQNG